MSSLCHSAARQGSLGQRALKGSRDQDRLESFIAVGFILYVVSTVFGAVS